LIKRESEQTMPKNKRALLDAEEQLLFGGTLSEMKRARDNLRAAFPGCLLLELLEAKIARRKHAPLSPWAA
jgi:hypothetical protein